MILDIRRGDLLGYDDAQHIAFAINVEGANDAGFAGQVFRHCEVESVTPPFVHGGLRVVSDHDGRQFYGMAIHSLMDGGWEGAPKLLEYGLNTIDERILQGERIHIALPGAGLIGQLQGADVLANLGAIARSTAEVYVWSL